MDCGKAPSSFCSKEVDCNTHQCYINHDVDTSQRQKRRQGHARRGRQECARHRAKAGLRTLQANQRDDLESEENDDEDNTPLFIYADLEARQVDAEHVPNLLCWDREAVHEEEYPEDLNVGVEWGEDCCEVFVDRITHIAEHEDHKLIVVFYNLKGYDRHFLLQTLYDLWMKVTRADGTKDLVLSIRERQGQGQCLLSADALVGSHQDLQSESGQVRQKVLSPLFKPSGTSGLYPRSSG